MPYCAVYNLTHRRFVAPFENLTFLGLHEVQDKEGDQWRH